MKFKNLSFHTQLFLASLLLVITPSIILGITTANKTAKQINEDYHNTLHTITRQTNLTLDTLLNDGEKVGSLYLFNDEIRKILNYNYRNDMMKLAQDNTKMTTQINQANSFNTNIISCIIKNKYGYTFNYNILNSKAEAEILKNMEIWAESARKTEHLKYFGPIQHPKYTGNIYKNILPMVKILYDPYTRTEMGVFYISINFDSIEEAVNRSKLKNSKILLYNTSNQLVYSSDPSYTTITPTTPKLFTELEEISSKITQNNPTISDKIDIY